jgi:hypothetical protein
VTHEQAIIGAIHAVEKGAAGQRIFIDAKVRNFSDAFDFTEATNKLLDRAYIVQLELISPQLVSVINNAIALAQV